MADAPERIRAVWCREEWFGKGSTGPEPMNKRHVGYFSTDATGTEFIRADLVDELVKALAAIVKAEDDALAECVKQGFKWNGTEPAIQRLNAAKAALTRIKGDGK